MSDNREERARYWLVARDKPGLLMAMMRALAGSAMISFEGDLSGCDFSRVPGTSADETECLRRATIYPRQDFVVCRLEPETIEPILAEVLPERRAIDRIIHIQIEKDGALAFGSYDNFHPDCIVAGPGVPVSLLEQLQASGVLRSMELKASK